MLEPDRLDELRPRAALLLDVARVGDLSAARGIEGRALELRLEEPVLELRVGGDRRKHLGPVVTHELGLRGRRSHLHVDRHAARPARDLPVFLHQARELLVVHPEPSLPRQLDRQLDREAVGRLEHERIPAADVAAARGRLLEDLHPPLERLGEALLLGRQHLMDLLAVLGELGVRVAHLLDHGVGEAGEERRLHPDPQAVLGGAPDDPAEDVAAALVRWRDTLARDERHPAAMVGEHAQRLRRVGAVVQGRSARRDPFRDLPIAVGVVDGRHVLEDPRRSL